MNATGFNTRANPFGEQVRSVYSSDIGHWDVPDMTEVTEEAYELVKHGILSEENFRDFVFTNPAALWAGMNPDFFTGTVVKKRLVGSWPRPSTSLAGRGSAGGIWNRPL